jgi:peptide-methionine (R)-S-oxide reductase
MKKSHIISLTALLAIGSTLIALADEKKTTEPEKDKKVETEKTEKTEKVVKTEAEWKKLLTPEQFRVARLAGTERAFSDAYEKFHHEGEGTYYCVCCNAELFTSNEKFDSRCGWPSFYDESKAKNIGEKVDITAGMKRTEVICKKCDAHLGHVFFNEGFNNPTNKRYCINAVAMRFVEAKDKVSKKAEKEEPKKEDKKK